MVNYADVGSEGCGDRRLAISRVAQDIASLALIDVALEVHADDIAALREKQRRVMHLDAEHLQTKRQMPAAAEALDPLVAVHADTAVITSPHAEGESTSWLESARHRLRDMPVRSSPVSTRTNSTTPTPPTCILDLLAPLN